MKPVTAILFFLLAIPGLCRQQPAEKPRTLITTDGEIDDVDSFMERRY